VVSHRNCRSGDAHRGTQPPATSTLLAVLHPKERILDRPHLTEWDLSALGDDVVALFSEADIELLGTLRRMPSVCVAAKCWVALDRGPEVREAAHLHLKLLRGERLD
jgi:hypothetical protein